MTIRYDRTTGGAGFLLHWRDPAKVGHAGGLYQVVPVGIFQPSSDQPRRRLEDLSLWRGLLREYAEELLGEPEQENIDYDSWEFGRRMTSGLRDGEIHAFCLGLGVDPLSLATDLIAAVVIDAPLFDELFASMVADNDEGRILTDRVELNAATVEWYGREERMQAAGSAALHLAQRHREHLLAR